MEQAVPSSVCFHTGAHGAYSHTIQLDIRPAIEKLTSKQRAHLRSLAHDLKPLVHIGKEGINEATVQATKEALNTRELLKVRVLDGAPTGARDVGHALAGQINDASLVQVIGHVVVLYRPFDEHPIIKLPA